MLLTEEKKKEEEIVRRKENEGEGVVPLESMNSMS